MYHLRLLQALMLLLRGARRRGQATHGCALRLRLELRRATTAAPTTSCRGAPAACLLVSYRTLALSICAGAKFGEMNQ